MRSLTAFIILLLSFGAQAELFKWKDAEGNIIYSDQPPPGAKKEEHKVEKESLPPIISTPALERPAASTSTSLSNNSQEEPDRYTSLAIVSPENDTSVRQNAGNVSIKVAIEPYLFNERGDLLVIYMDGQEVSRGRESSIQLIEVDRGTHVIGAEIVDASGNSIKTASPVTFTLHRHSVLFNTNANN